MGTCGHCWVPKRGHIQPRPKQHPRSKQDPPEPSTGEGGESDGGCGPRKGPAGQRLRVRGGVVGMVASACKDGDPAPGRKLQLAPTWLPAAPVLKPRGRTQGAAGGFAVTPPPSTDREQALGTSWAPPAQVPHARTEGWGQPATGGARAQMSPGGGH